jgi:hypothetical protein
MNIIVEEEFGYKYYMWKSPFSNNQDLINWWNGINPNTIEEIVFPSGRETGTDIYQSTFGGRWSSVDIEDIHGQGLNWMHIHTPEDSYLEIAAGNIAGIGGRYYIKMENSNEHSTSS